MKHLALPASLLFLFALLLSAPAPSEAVVVDFTLNGTLNVTFNGTNLTGDIPVAAVTAPGTISSGILTFTTGNVTGTPTAGLVNFAPGGSFSIAGSFDGNPSTTLLGGSLQQVQIQGIPIGASWQYLVIIGAFNAPTLDSTFATYYFGSVPPAAQGGFGVGYMLTTQQDLSQPFSQSIFASGSLQAAPVPLPPSTLLLAPGLLGMFGLRRRFSKF
jgi:hypothetical protein